ncbi:unnamed protein product [Mytilus edulis]|uniref:Uncharacterized protein n=1 Tax=Mytilus edulis TaxID=6550 RepID=A0A8S3T033_MYTED|nr:unnamed protein product [Mytilus edulis]
MSGRKILETSLGSPVTPTKNLYICDSCASLCVKIYGLKDSTKKTFDEFERSKCDRSYLGKRKQSFSTPSKTVESISPFSPPLFASPDMDLLCLPSYNKECQVKLDFYRRLYLLRCTDQVAIKRKQASINVQSIGEQQQIQKLMGLVRAQEQKRSAGSVTMLERHQNNHLILTTQSEDVILHALITLNVETNVENYSINKGNALKIWRYKRDITYNHDYYYEKNIHYTHCLPYTMQA